GANTATGDDQADPSANQVRRQLGQSIEPVFPPAVDDCYIVAFDVTGLLEALAKSAQSVPHRVGRPGVEEGDHRHCRLLRARRERPRKRRRRRAAEQLDELAPASHSITSSARPSNGSDKPSPSALAVFMLMTSSTFVACCTGSSAGFSPLSSRPAYVPNR